MRKLTKKQKLVLKAIKSELTNHFKDHKWPLRPDVYAWQAIHELLGLDFMLELDGLLHYPHGANYEYKMEFIDGHIVGYLVSNSVKATKRKKRRNGSK